MDALDQLIEQEIMQAKDFLIIAATPGGPFKCGCGGPIVRPQDRWVTPFRIRRHAYGRLNVGSGSVGLAMSQLIHEGTLLVNEPNLMVRLNPNFRRTNRFKQLLEEGRRFERSRSRTTDC